MTGGERMEDSAEPIPGWEDRWPPISYWSRAAAVVIGVVIVVRILAALQNVLLIVVAAFVIALGLQPALALLEKRGMRRGAAMGVIVLGGLVLMTAAAAAILPTVVSQALTAAERLPEIMTEIRDRSPMLGDLLAGIDLTGGDGEMNGAFVLAGSLAQGVFNTVTLLLLTPYFAVAFPTMKSRMFRLLRSEHREDFVYVINKSTELTSNYIIGNLIISIAAGVVTFAGLTLIGVPYAMALAAWVAITDLVPAVGALIGAIPVVTVAALSGGEELLWSVALLVAYQQVENYLLAPRVMKRAVDLSPPVVIIALMVGGTLAGIVGALLVLPVAALTKILVSEFLVRRRIDKVRADGTLEQPASRSRRYRGRVGSRPLP